MTLKMDLIWWYWAITDALLIAGVAGVSYGIEAAIVFNVIQVVHFYARTPDVKAFPVQVRLAYLALLLVALYPPLFFLYYLIILGTSAMVFFDYCFLARFMSLMPWNHSERFSWGLIRSTFFSKPVDGSVQKA
ncbi:hypothetical protein [Hydrogenovibrio thermophilus]|uniref:Uncharacterized protein n=1 Tax=Hydrogenovibrio thermophilus TaxID=265883 RepID=A0A410H4G3_9GAMM|nr:hypothetical protein [Hydrogenovibrio thermophilus]QAB15822.1 hypothetical protein EPV75_09130 [Hydrogenovibrio thermophilus]